MSFFPGSLSSDELSASPSFEDLSFDPVSESDCSESRLVFVVVGWGCPPFRLCLRGVTLFEMKPRRCLLTVNPTFLCTRSLNSESRFCWFAKSARLALPVELMLRFEPTTEVLLISSPRVDTCSVLPFLGGALNLSRLAGPGFSFFTPTRDTLPTRAVRAPLFGFLRSFHAPIVKSLPSTSFEVRVCI